MMLTATVTRPLACNINRELPILSALSHTIDPKVLKLALTAYQCARKTGMDEQTVLSVIDYTRPSNEKRLWVYNIRHNRLLFNTLVAHGEKTGNLMARYFSDRPGSHESSVGLYLTGKAYAGTEGYSLR